MKPVESCVAADEPELKRRLEQSAQPLLLRGLVRHWPAVHAGRETALGICDYLRRFDQGTEVIATKTRASARGVMGFNEALTDFDFVKARMGLAEFMAHLQAYLPVEGVPSIAAQCAKVSEVIPGFLAENSLNALPGVIPNFWLGNALTVPVHHDHPYNIACVVAGRRRFTLFAPEQVGNLYMGPLEFTPSGAPISVVHPNQPDLERYPRYREALACAQIAEMEPGDALYIPPLWFHQVEALEKVNLLINYWWPVMGEPELPSPVASLLQAIKVLNAIPAHQRDAWAAMFEHYVVQRKQDPAAHIPAQMQGVLARRS
ncbi:cupin-like domain-containing protein [Roseateles oligotrophus]|uniref:Cupin-like domain-containing protein n=1 Tax=Roseateles oligotrophus TaxID=1769250 RepID=A0ABT2YDP9_9BURK|nr:cupin-like domain-containing protein [Roseateles oligotrophus]MCV2368156.1 cupin-like domain-containing protein [Roseateles oligotrophus]